MVVIGHLELTDGGQGTSASLRLRGRDLTADLGLRREEQDVVQKGARQARAGARRCEAAGQHRWQPTRKSPPGSLG